MIAATVFLIAALAIRATAQTIYPGDASWAYKGCFNETSQLNASSGLRALNNGPTTTNDQMDVPVCLASCKGYKYAGVEYTKECYCSNYIHPLSNQLADSDCNLACVANATQICGGSLKVSVYEVKPDAGNAKGAASHTVVASVMGILALGLVGGLLMY